MENRDNIIEEQLKNSVENIPDSLKPNNMEQRLLQMTQEERFSRSMSVDIPDDNETKRLAKSDKSKDKKSGKKKVIIPMAIAASVLLAAGVGAYFMFNRASSKSSDSSQGLAVTEDENSKENNSTENYKKAYRRLKAYKEYSERQIDVIEEYEVMEESDMAAESTEAARQYSNSAKSGDAELGTTGTTPSFTDTNVRTEGVGEADIAKTDGKYIYVYDDFTEHLNIYSVEDGKIEKVGTINVLKDGEQFDEMYIYEDRLVLIGKIGSYYYDKETTVTVYDISDRTDPKMEKKIVQSGDYMSSRMVGNVVYTFSQKSFELDEIKKRKYESYVPEVDGEVLENGQIIVPDKSFCDSYMVATSINVDSVEVIDKMAMLGGADSFYVSSNNIYFIDRYYDWKRYTYEDSSSITKISYDEGDFKYVGKGTFPGYIINDYSIDEYDGYLRLVSTYRDEDYTQYNGLFVFNNDLEQVSVIKKLAEGETIRSARFTGETAYFVTFRNTDPLFAVDLSDPENPKVTDYLKIPGFSAYLHPYGDDKLLGIGYDTDESGITNSIKLSMFDISDPYDIEEIETKVLYDYSQASVLQDRRAFMFNPEDGTFGFSTMADLRYLEDDWYKEYYEEEYDELIEHVDLDKDGVYYTVFDYDDDKGFENLMEEHLDEMYGNLMSTRGIVIGDYIYVVESGSKVTSYDTENYKQFDECN